MTETSSATTEEVVSEVTPEQIVEMFKVTRAVIEAGSYKIVDAQAVINVISFLDTLIRSECKGDTNVSTSTDEA